MDWCHVTFDSASGAMAAQGLLRGKHRVTVMPVLRQVSAGCGIALRVAAEDAEAVRHILKEGGIEGVTLYAVTGTGEALRCERL